MEDAFHRLALVLLAAGASARFGGPKLAASLHGRPLIHHAAKTFSALPFARRYAVTGSDDFGLAGFGFEIVGVGSNPEGRPEPMSHSIAAGVCAAMRTEPAGVMIALGDMPFVTRIHVVRLVASFDGSRIGSAVGGQVGTRVTPPAIFGPDWLAQLTTLSGDAGARDLLHDAPLVAADARTLADIDTPGDLAERDPE